LLEEFFMGDISTVNDRNVFDKMEQERVKNKSIRMCHFHYLCKLINFAEHTNITLLKVDSSKRQIAFVESKRECLVAFYQSGEI
jgi:hypothetical protein